MNLRNNQLLEQINSTTKFLQKHLEPFKGLDTAVVLGSGFSGIRQSLPQKLSIPLSDIPNVPVPSVAGHDKTLEISQIHDGRYVVFVAGRVHLYEGYTCWQVVFLIRALIKAGIKNIILTNASGGLTNKVQPGEVMLICDQINLTGESCLAKEGQALGDPFVNMVHAYDPKWRQRLQESLQQQGLNTLPEGVYVGVKGPAYETPAETQMFAKLGGHIVGMSTVQECMAARQLKARVLGLSLVTNLAGGLAMDVNHEEVLSIGKKKEAQLAAILKEAIQTTDTKRIS